MPAVGGHEPPAGRKYSAKKRARHSLGRLSRGGLVHAKPGVTMACCHVGSAAGPGAALCQPQPQPSALSPWRVVASWCCTCPTAQQHAWLLLLLS